MAVSINKNRVKIISPYLCMLALVILTMFTLSPMLYNGFSYMAADDDWMLYRNSQVYSLAFSNIFYYFTHFYTGQYSPLNTLAYSIINFLFGMNPFWYHIFSLILHIVNLLLVYKLINYILKLYGMINGLTITGSDRQIISFFTALLFAIHPIHVESIAWISASKVVFYSFLFLLSLIIYLRYIESKQLKYYFISLSLFIASLGIKEQTVVFPLCLMLIDWYIKRGWTRKKILIEKIPFFIIAIGFGIIEIFEQSSAFGPKFHYDYYPFFQRLLLACYAIPVYLFKLFAPIHLSWYYFPMGPGKPLSEIFWFYPVVILAVFSFIFRSWRRGRRYILFGMGFFLINVVLTLHLIPMAREEMMADRYIYLSSIGIFFITSRLLLMLFKSLKSRSLPWYLYMLCLILYITYLCSYTYLYAGHWS